MNYLAHLLLSGHDPDWQLGGLLGDFVKGPLISEPVNGGLPAEIQAGIRLHRRIDVLTDSHPAYLDSLPRLGPEWRRYAGIALDIWFDHILSRQWPRWGPQPLEQFCAQCWVDFHQREQTIPANAKTFIQRAEQFKLLPGYRDPLVIERTLERVGQRLKRPMPLQQMLPALQRASPALENNFEQLFTDLIRQAELFRQQYAEEASKK